MNVAYIDVARPSDDPDAEAALELREAMLERMRSTDPEQTEFAAWCDVADNLYFPIGRTAGGASHWAGHVSAKKPGLSHVSDNVYPTYVDVPAALQSVPPVQRMMATDVTEESRQFAQMAERLYMAWMKKERGEMKFHQAAVVKELYGRTAAKVWWDDEAGHPRLEIVEQPRNLRFGWRDSNYHELEWALYCYSITPAAALEDWGLMVDSYKDENGTAVAYIAGGYGEGQTWRARQANDDLKIEVYDYWYRRPVRATKRTFGKPVKFETWNAIFVGNALVKNQKHPEYDGRMPYLPIFNTFIPGEAKGRPAFWDIEQIIREKDEKLSENSQMVSRAIRGQMWQLRGDNAPNKATPDMRPEPNTVKAYGGGTYVEAIQPWMPEFQIEAYLARMDRELVDVSGLNDLLRGMAPHEALSSSKAITALTANYEVRLRMRRDLYYYWRMDCWNLAAVIWKYKTKTLKDIIEAGSLDLLPPSLMPRDDSESAVMARNLLEGKLWSQARAMDRVGVEDPEVEQDIIRAESTDAALFPDRVQIIATLTATMAQLAAQSAEINAMLASQREPRAGLGPPGLIAGEVPGVASQRGARSPADLRSPGEAQPQVPPGQAPNPEGLAAPEGQVLSQSMIQGGEVTPRIVQSAAVVRSGE